MVYGIAGFDGATSILDGAASRTDGSTSRNVEAYSNLSCYGFSIKITYYEVIF